MIERTPQEFEAIIPPSVQYSCVEGSGPKVSWCSFSALWRRWSRISPGSTRASLRSGSISSTRLRYLEKSITTATLVVWPARPVPPPREHGDDHIVHRSRDDDADRQLPVVRARRGVEAAVGGREANLAFDHGAEGVFER